MQLGYSMTSHTTVNHHSVTAADQTSLQQTENTATTYISLVKRHLLTNSVDFLAALPTPIYVNRGQRWRTF